MISKYLVDMGPRQSQDSEWACPSRGTCSSRYEPPWARPFQLGYKQDSSKKQKNQSALNKCFTSGQEERRHRKQWPACQWFSRNARLKALTRLHMELSVSLSKTQGMHFPLGRPCCQDIQELRFSSRGQCLWKSYQLCSNSEHRCSDAIWNGHRLTCAGSHLGQSTTLFSISIESFRN